jgi:hypothetical protein
MKSKTVLVEITIGSDVFEFVIEGEVSVVTSSI